MKFRTRWPPSNPPVEVAEGASLGDLLIQVEVVTQLERDAFTVRSGFPPANILGGEQTPLTSLGLTDGELLTIIENSQMGQQAHSKAKVPKKMVNEAMRPTNQRSSLPSESSAPRTPKRRRSLPTPSVSSTVSGGIRVHQLASAGGSPPSRSSEGRKKRRGEGLNWGGSQEEWAVGLVDTFSKSAGDLTKAESMIKKAFKGAVQRRAASTLAEQRWASAQGDTYKMTQLSPVKFQVEFPIGLRSLKKEEYAELPEILVAAIIREVYSSGGESMENLRPYYVAEAHPMIFWNIIKVSSGDFVKGLRTMVPEVDWSFTEERRKFLSEKAINIIKQREEREAQRLERKALLASAAASGEPVPEDSGLSESDEDEEREP
eukprot:GHVN01038400.1.p1 GENE.GHVN01038400.1~~GHVN01038400.1.p1  ORF type:complete len:375 (+),score=65.31 GHVN01038400.1:193-1317(+)